MPSFVTHLEAATDGTKLDANVPQTTYESRPLWVRYDLDAVSAAVTKDGIAARPPDMWRYRELLPVEDDIVTLGEGMTPLLPAPRLARALGLRNLMVKDEAQLPTGSFKSRGLAAAVTRAKELGIKRVAIPTAGNAGGALAAYAARAALEAWVFMPADTPRANQVEAVLHGARTYLVNGLIDTCARIVAEGKEPMGWFDMSTMKEPYRIEGKKTMGLELAEQMGWTLPDVILYPTGGGTGLVGMWKAFAEMQELGWIGPGSIPRMIACQSTGCSPIADAFESGDRYATAPANPHTVASGLRVPSPIGDFMILDAVRESGGTARAVSDADLLSWTKKGAEQEGIGFSPEGGCCLAVLADLVADGSVSADETVMVWNTGAAQKYTELFFSDLPLLDRPVDWDEFGHV